MRMRLPAAVLLLLSTAACMTPAHADGERRATALAAPVTYEVSSWGRLVTRWQVNADGTGEIWRGTGPGKGPGEVRKFRLKLEPEAMDVFAPEVEALRQATGKPLPCKRTITDQPYGTVTWGSGAGRQAWSFDRGCRSPSVDKALAQLDRAIEAIEITADIEAQPYAVDTPS